MSRPALTAIMTLLLAAAAPRAGAAVDPPGSAVAEEALALCKTAPAASPAEQREMLARGLSLAQRALDLDERDAKAHFAYFCNLALQMRSRGASVSNLGAIGRLKRALERALAIVPDYVDALVGKAAVLLNLPRLLGGNPREGEDLLRHVLEVDPEHAIARLFLAQALAERGARAEARREVEAVLAAAERSGNAVDAAEARLMIAALDD